VPEIDRRKETVLRAGLGRTAGMLEPAEIISG